MKTLNNIFALFFITLFISCSSDEGVSAGTVEVNLFEDTSVSENSASIDLNLEFDEPVKANGYVVVKITSTEENAFNTVPTLEGVELEMLVAKGAVSVSIILYPQDNLVQEGNTIVTFELIESSKGIAFGTKRRTTLEILDNE